MKKPKGFISIIVIIVTALSLIMLLYILDVNRLQALTTFHARDQTQSTYNSESKILLCINDEEYLREKLNPILFNIFRTSNFGSMRMLNIDPIDLENGDNEDIIRISFKDIDDRKNMQIKSKSNMKGNITNATAIASLVNETYEIQIPLIDIKALEGNLESIKLEGIKKTALRIEEDIDIDSMGISETIYSFQTDDYKNINLIADKLVCIREGMSIPYSEILNKRELFIVCRKYNDSNINFYIDKANSKNALSGIIYIEGDLYINADLKFNGIIIINGGELIIEDGKRLSVGGMIMYINNDEERQVPDNLDIEYKRRIIYKYGTYLPQFFDIKVKLIKSN